MSDRNKQNSETKKGYRAKFNFRNKKRKYSVRSFSILKSGT